jgi:hypothetical protein
MPRFIFQRTQQTKRRIKVGISQAFMETNRRRYLAWSTWFAVLTPVRRLHVTIACSFIPCAIRAESSTALAVRVPVRI